MLNFYFAKPKRGPQTETIRHNVRAMRQVIQSWGYKDANSLSYEDCIERMIEHVRKEFQQR